MQAIERQQEVERYQKAWAALAVAQGSWAWRPGDDLVGATNDPAPGVRETAMELVPVPKIDVSTLSLEQRAAWRALRLEFATVAAKVHQARVILDDLYSRGLQRQGMSLHPRWASTALTMQGFLADAADLAEACEFEQATEALRRAEQQRSQLRDATGQY